METFTKKNLRFPALIILSVLMIAFVLLFDKENNIFKKGIHLKYIYASLQRRFILMVKLLERLNLVQSLRIQKKLQRYRERQQKKGDMKLQIYIYQLTSQLALLGFVLQSRNMRFLLLIQKSHQITQRLFVKNMEQNILIRNIQDLVVHFVLRLNMQIRTSSSLWIVMVLIHQRIFQRFMLNL